MSETGSLFSIKGSSAEFKAMETITNTLYTAVERLDSFVAQLYIMGNIPKWLPTSRLNKYSSRQL